MASKVLKSFLIGIGYDTKGLEAGDKKINASLNGIKSGALGISAALVGAFGTAAGAIVGVADRVDRLALSTQNLRTSMNTVYGFGSAVKLMGGEASEALDALAGFEEIQNNLRLKGEAGPINDLAMAGLDVSSLYATGTGEEFMRALAEMIPNLDEGQRSIVQGSLGLSDGVFRSLAGGVEKLDETMRRASGLTGSVDQLTEDARRLAENSSEFGLIIEGIKNELAEGFLPSLVGAGSALNNFLRDHRDEISSAVDYAADNPAATAALGVSATTALIGAAISKIGLGTVGGLASKSGAAGVAVTGGAIGSNLLNRALDEYVPGYSGASQGFDEMLKSVTGLERIKGPIELLFGGNGFERGAPPASEDPKTTLREDLPSVSERADVSSTEIPETYTGTVIRSKEDIGYLERRDGTLERNHGRALPRPSEDADSISDASPPQADVAPRKIDLILGERSAMDSMPPESTSTRDQDIQASAEALGGVLSRSPIKVHNQLGVTLQLDGQALESKIVQVNERQNYETLGDLKTTTER